jgi:hypothetical protein
MASVGNRLLPVLWKIDRAETLLDELRQGAAILGWTTTWSGIQVREPASSDRRRWLVDCSYPAPFRFDSVAADFIHNVRAALDQLAWRLAGCPPNRSTSFPILVKRRTGQLLGTSGMKASALAKLEAFQPYNGAGHDAALWLLHDLWTQDKHRSTPLVSILQWTRFAEVLNSTAPNLPVHGDLAQAFATSWHDGATYLISEPQPVQFTLTFAAQQAGRGRNLFQLAEELLSLVRDTILPAFVDKDYPS